MCPYKQEKEWTNTQDMVKATHPDRNSQRNTHRENRKEKKDLKRVKTGTKKEERSQSNKQT